MTTAHKPTTGITLYRGFQGSGAYVWSPFVNKLEARLRFAGLSYSSEAGSPMKAPRGKIPYVKISKPDAENETPTLLGDSSLIIGHLMDEGLLEDLNATISPADKAHDAALRALLEDKLYFYQVNMTHLIYSDAV
jgi:Glutathione S-transferase N-terminal domain